jgi:hypothetical protein
VTTFFAHFRLKSTAYKELMKKSAGTSPSTKKHIHNSLLANMVDSKTVQVLKDGGHPIESLQQEAMADKSEQLFQLDQQIALQTKILAGLQASYEVAFNRKLHVERLQLQNALLRRDVEGIEVVAEEFSTNDQP